MLHVLLELIRRSMVLMGDPAYRIKIRGIELVLPFSHKLPFYVADYPFYDHLPVRLSAYLREEDGYLSMVDVGANVGDTILACHERDDDFFLAIEANPEFVLYLKRNSSRIKNFKLVQAVCSKEDRGMERVKVQAKNGTASIATGANGNLIIPKITLDSILDKDDSDQQCNFLKIDTDGSDFDVIVGAARFIREVKPVILMECDKFDNKNYIQGYSTVMNIFVEAGYSYVLAYDNYGYLLDIFPVKNFAKFKHALFHQLIIKSRYYDLLILDPSHRAFVDSEVSFFVDQIQDVFAKKLAREALNL